MDLRYHTCGCPIRVWEECLQRNGEPTFFDGQSWAGECVVRRCPRCGQRVSRAVLRPKHPTLAATVADYVVAWPCVRRQLEELVVLGVQQGRLARLDEAQAEILELEEALNRVVELAARFDEPAVTSTVGEPADNCAAV